MIPIALSKARADVLRLASLKDGGAIQIGQPKNLVWTRLTSSRSFSFDPPSVQANTSSTIFLCYPSAMSSAAPLHQLGKSLLKSTPTFGTALTTQTGFLTRSYGTEALKAELVTFSRGRDAGALNQRFTPVSTFVGNVEYLGPFYNKLNDPKFLKECIHKEYIFASPGRINGRVAARGHHLPLPPNSPSTIEFYVRADQEGVDKNGPIGSFTGFQIDREEPGPVPVIVTRFNDEGGNERLVDGNSNAIPPILKGGKELK